MQKIIYIYRIAVKLFSFAFFGLCSLGLALGLFPIMHVLAGFSEKKFKAIARRFNHWYFKVFVNVMKTIRCISVNVENKEQLLNIKSKVVIANHPSLLDVVILFSLIPNADCIVKGSLIENKFISLIVRNLYIPNTIPFDEQMERARQSMEEGNNLIIFPEGTRSRPGQPWEFKKGAARFALFSENDVVPIFFGGNEKIGLRKCDKLLQYHPTERYQYNLKVLPQISAAPYKGVPMTKSAIKLTEKMKMALEQELSNV